MEGYLADTSVFIAAEQRRRIGPAPTGEARISVATISELSLGVRRAGDSAVADLRRLTLEQARSFIAMPFDEPSAERFAGLVARAREEGRRIGAMDTIIAATALAHELAVWSGDADFEALHALEPELRVVSATGE